LADELAGAESGSAAKIAEAVGIGIFAATLGRISEHEEVLHFMRDNVSVHVERRANIRMPHELLLHRQSEFPRPPAGDGTFPVAAPLSSLQCPNGSA
jgi:hypothetical protein